MKTAKAGIEKSVWSLVLGLGLVLAAQAQPADSTGAGRVISSQGTISSSSGTTGTLTAERFTPLPAPTPAPVPQSGTNIAWTMYFKNTSRCDWASCANIDGIGQISWASNYPWNWGTESYGPKFPIGFNAVAIGVWLTCKFVSRGESVDIDHPVTAKPTINPSTGDYIDWVMEGSGAGAGCDFSGSGGF